MPLIVEFETVRLGPHSKGDDTLAQPQQVEALWQRDWLALYAASMPERIKAATERQQERLAEIVRAVRMRPLSRWAVT